MRRFSDRLLAETIAPTATSILIDIDPAAGVTIFDYVALKDFISSLFEGPVDVIDREALKPHLRQLSAQDTVYAF